VDVALAELSPWPAGTPPISLEPGRLPGGEAPLSVRHAELISARTALAVLAAAPPLRDEALLDTRAPVFALGPEEVTRVVARADRLENDLLRLARSQRPDWGRAMLVGMARLAALRRSAADRRLQILDVIPNSAARVSADLIRRRPEALSAIASDLHASLVAARDVFLVSEAAVERPLARLEAAAARSVEVEAGVAGGRDVRFFSGLPPPARSALRGTPGLPGWSSAELSNPEADLALSRARARDFSRRLTSLYEYDLFSANCVSQIFAEIEVAFAEGGASGAADPAASRRWIRGESERRLGGYVEIDGTLNFIPFVSARAVRGAYRVAETRTELSRRLARVEAMRESEPAWRVALRESNTLTSTVYRGHPEDSLFLFFTDDQFWLRPLMGVANVVVGLGETLAGLAWLPFDAGGRLRSGLDGVLFSLPELAFFNIRKGRLEAPPRTAATSRRPWGESAPDSDVGRAGDGGAVAAEGPLHSANGGEHVRALGNDRNAGVRPEPLEGALESNPG
jgi:hypothetical protein